MAGDTGNGSGVKGALVALIIHRESPQLCQLPPRQTRTFLLPQTLPSLFHSVGYSCWVIPGKQQLCRIYSTSAPSAHPHLSLLHHFHALLILSLFMEQSFRAVFCCGTFFFLPQHKADLNHKYPAWFHCWAPLLLPSSSSLLLS